MASALDTFEFAVKQHKQFASTVQNFQERLLSDLQRSSEKAESFFTGLVTSLMKSTTDVIERINSSLKSVLTDVSDLEMVIFSCARFTRLLREPGCQKNR